ncbi:hypothetical protein RN04_07095 [Arthrobacter sp. W1]|nr:hypothetical protein RN04_07095 [Arthrobacter sp. W1]
MRTLTHAGDLERWAEISEDALYRYALGRRWDVSLPECVFIMLNPSTADGSQDDPTIRRCIRFAQDFGCGSLLVGNLYAFRATDPKELFQATEPIGGEANDSVLADLMMRGEHVIAAWGNHGKDARVQQVAGLPGAERLKALGTTKSGAPRHPLYVPASAAPTSWRVAV